MTVKKSDKKENTKQTYNDFVNEIAQSIKEIIKTGGATWKDVFHRDGCAKLPVNVKGNLYSGVNVLIFIWRNSKIISNPTNG